MDLSPTVDNIETTYNHLEINHPDNTKHYRVCGALTASNTPCQLAAGKGTKHKGMGRCNLHGGNNGAGPDNPGWRHGRRAVIWRQRMKALFTAQEIDDLYQDPLDLAAELAVNRLLVALAWDKMMQQGEWIDESGEKINRTNVQSAPNKDGTEGGDTTIQSKGYPTPIPGAKFLPSSDDLKIVSDLLKDTGLAHSRIVRANTSIAMTMRDKAALLKVMYEGIDLFVPEDDKRAFLSYLRDRLLGGKEIDERLLDVDIGLLESGAIDV